MVLEELFSQLSLWMANCCLKSFAFYFYFIIYFHQSSWIPVRIKYGSGFTTLFKTTNSNTWSSFLDTRHNHYSRFHDNSTNCILNNHHYLEQIRQIISFGTSLPRTLGVHRSDSSRDIIPNDLYNVAIWYWFFCRSQLATMLHAVLCHIQYSVTRDYAVDTVDASINPR